MELVEDWSETMNFGEKVYVTTGIWKLKKSLTTIIITTPDKNKRILDFDKYHGEEMEAFLNNSIPENREATAILYRYLFDKFRKRAKHDPKTHIITTAYCNLALTHNTGKADGIYYPSVPFSGKGFNLAINSDFATFDNIELVHVIRNELSISENENEKHSFLETDLRESIRHDTANNIIEW